MRLLGYLDSSSRTIQCIYCAEDIPRTEQYWRFHGVWSRRSRGAHIFCMIGLTEDLLKSLFNITKRKYE